MSVFHYRGALAPDDPLFVGPAMRWEMKAALADLADIASLCQPPLDSYVILFGARQAGKTSLMYRLGPRLAGHAHLVLVELQLLQAPDLAQVFQHIGHELACQVSPSHKDSAESVRDGTDFREFLCQLTRDLPVVVALDEVGALPPDVALALSNSLRALHQSRHRSGYQALATYLFLLAGGIELYESVTSSVTSPLRNISERFYLTDLSKSLSDDLLSRGLMQLGLDDERIRALSNRIYHHARGHPYLTQRLGATVEWALRRDAEPDTGMIDEAVARLTDEDDTHIVPIIKSLRAEGLWDAAIELAKNPGTIPFSHFDDVGERLMLLGLIREEDEKCVVRNPIYADALRAVDTCPGRDDEPQPPPTTEIKSLKRQLASLKRNLLTIEERKARFIDPRNVPPDLAQSEKLTRENIARIEAQLAEREP